MKNIANNIVKKVLDIKEYLAPTIIYDYTDKIGVRYNKRTTYLEIYIKDRFFARAEDLPHFLRDDGKGNMVYTVQLLDDFAIIVAVENYRAVAITGFRFEPEKEKEDVKSS